MRILLTLYAVTAFSLCGPLAAEAPLPPPPSSVIGDGAGNSVLYFDNAGQCYRNLHYYEGLVETAEELGNPWYWTPSDRCEREADGQWSYEIIADYD